MTFVTLTAHNAPSEVTVPVLSNCGQSKHLFLTYSHGLFRLEPATNRFCLKCCKEENDQENCNSHNDRAGCDDAITGTYDFPAIGVSCS